jgi:hypothetical protein
MRRALALAGGALVGVVAGVQVMFVAQDAGSGPVADRPPTTVPVEVDATPLPTAPSGPKALLAWTPTTLDPALEPAALATPDVSSVSMVRGAVVDLVASRDGEGRIVQQLDPGWAIPLDAIAIDSAAHDDLVPLADRATVAGLRQGEALLSRTSASLRRLAPGGTLELAGATSLTVVGIVDDVTIGGAELAVTSSTGAGIGLDDPRYLLLAYEGDRAAVETRLRAALPADAPVRFRAPGETPFLRQGDAVLPPLRLKTLFGEFAYLPPADGQREFVQDPAWQSEHLVERDMPIVGPMRCHRGVVDAIEGALTEIESANLAGLVDPAGFAGCWNPRLVRPGGDLSHHAWGVAFDLNYATNPSCQESVQDHRLVEVFDRWGFTWGGGWLCPDPAHFEFATPPNT